MECGHLSTIETRANFVHRKMFKIPAEVRIFNLCFYVMSPIQSIWRFDFSFLDSQLSQTILEPEVTIHTPKGQSMSCPRGPGTTILQTNHSLPVISL